MKKIEVKNITKYYDKLRVIDDISLTLRVNEFVSILGPSGCGKSTLFNIISGLLAPDKGTILIDGKIHTSRTGRISYMHQSDLLLPWKNIMDNVCVPLILKGYNKKEAYTKALEHFPLFGLNDFEKSFPNQLSGGMRQRASLLRAYLFSDDIMLLDEPFGRLDAITKKKMHYWLLDVIDRLAASVMFITHDIDEAILLSDKIYVLTERPASIKADFNVNIKKPRVNSIEVSAEYINLKKEILKIL